jgi:YYY domain-containing protein
MGNDIWVVLRWWATLFVIGAAAWPLTKKLFSLPAGWFDDGYLFSKAVGMATITFLVYLAGSLHIFPFTTLTIIWAMVFVLIVGLWLGEMGRHKKERYVSGVMYQASRYVLEELFFFAALLFWSWVKGHEPSIHGLEKFMDYGFTQSILNSRYFPAPDMWYAGFPINYYYFGHTVVAVLTRLSGIDLSYTFNLMLAAIFALCFTMSFSIGMQLSNIQYPISNKPIRKKSWGIGIAAGLLTAFLVTLAGNMQTIYAFTRGYTGEDVKPFWDLLWKIGELWQKLPEGLERYWYANATRFIPFTIHEFPSYSFVVSDVHGHVLSIPFVLLAIAIIITLSHLPRSPRFGEAGRQAGTIHYSLFTFYGFLCGVLLMTNALDGPVYFALLIAVLVIFNPPAANRRSGPILEWKAGAITFAAAIVTSTPFLAHFKSFVNGLAIDCPPRFFANTKIGPILFEGVEKCQKSPIWMMWLLWGFFIYCGTALIVSKFQSVRTLRVKKLSLISRIRDIWNTKYTQTEQLFIVFFFFSFALIIFPELFYFKDIYPAHFRSNTMFKLGYQAFIMFSIISGYTIVKLLSSEKQIVKLSNCHIDIRKIFTVLLIPQLFLVSIYPIFSVRSYFNSLRYYDGLDGLAWMKRQHPDDWSAIQWMKSNVSHVTCRVSKDRVKQIITHDTCSMTPVVIEADGDSYTDYARISAFTGLPTVVGWPVHEWLWRGSYDVVAPRREDVRIIYESGDIEDTKTILRKYNVRYIIAGGKEREKYPQMNTAKFEKIARLVFTSGGMRIYEYTSR